mgnify:CR=1 FL=1
MNISCNLNGKYCQINSEWETLWSLSYDSPKLKGIDVLFYEEVIRRASNSQKLFIDVTRSVFRDDAAYTNQLLKSTDHWRSRIARDFGLDVVANHGIALGDVNGDGLDDFFLCQEPGLPNRLFIQEKDGQAVESSKEWGIDWIEDSRSSIIADFDNDGDQDLAVACYGMVVIAENVQEKRFEPAAILKTSWSTSSLAAADYDNDGLIDLYVCAYVNEDNGNSIGTDSNEFVYHDAENGASNTMYKNVTKGIGKISFLDVTDEVGLNVNNSRWITTNEFTT